MFKLIDSSDQYALDIAERLARRLLAFPLLGAKSIFGLANAIYALQRMPAATPGVCVEYGITYRNGTPEFSEMKYVTIRITEDEIELSEGGSVYEKAVGGDSYTRPGWLMTASGGGCRECDLCSLDDTITDLINLKATPNVCDDSEIDYDFTVDTED